MIFDDLRAIQSQYGYLPGEQLEAMSKRTQIPLYRIHGVADFYPHFHLKPPPKVNLRVCSDMSCHLRGAEDLKAALEQRFRGMSDKDVKVGDVSCLGQCDGEVHRHRRLADPALARGDRDDPRLGVG